MRVNPPLAEGFPSAPADRLGHELELTTVYAQHADFVWRSLQRLGVPAQDLEDAFQETFVVVHRRLSDFGGRSKLTTWLFGICLRVAKRQRRLGFLRELAPEGAPEPVEHRTPEREAQQRQAERLLAVILDRLTPEQRAVFTMFEFEQIDCPEIAAVMGVPVGTVYSRLHAARARFQREHERLERRGGPR